MNTTEHIVESYFRLVRGCLTSVDVKVEKGIGRQLDLLADDLKSGTQYHAEISVKHGIGFNHTVEEMIPKACQKFFGCEKGTTTPTHLQALKDTYASVGFDFQKVVRVWVPWVITDSSDPCRETEAQFKSIAKRFGVRQPRFELLLFRDAVIPELMKSIGSSNYDDLILRTLSLLNIREKQTRKSKRIA